MAIESFIGGAVLPIGTPFRRGVQAALLRIRVYRCGAGTLRVHHEDIG